MNNYVKITDNSITINFFTKNGGYSSGIYSSLNCSFNSYDNYENIIRNREKCADEMNIDIKELVTTNQVHGMNVITVNDLWDYDNCPKADGMVTKQKNIALSILTADCAPVLFADYNNKVIGASHAGWKGALSGVIENTLEAMNKLGANNSSTEAYIGPCISKKSYEVDQDFFERFIQVDNKNIVFFQKTKKNKKLSFDLKGFVASKLKQKGIIKINTLDRDTFRLKDDYFSYRRALHEGNNDYGRQMSSIVLMG